MISEWLGNVSVSIHAPRPRRQRPQPLHKLINPQHHPRIAHHPVPMDEHPVLLPLASRIIPFSFGERCDFEVSVVALDED